MKIKQINREVLYNIGANIGINRKEIAALKEKARMNRRKRVRLCAHNSIKNKLHEMFIVHAKDTYVRPHKHLKKAESLHVIEGSADLVLFDNRGSIKNVIRLGDNSSGDKFYYRISTPVFHMLLIRSRFIVFHEATSGPFKRSATIMAQWSPEETDLKRRKEFMGLILKAAGLFTAHNKKDE